MENEHPSAPGPKNAALIAAIKRRMLLSVQHLFPNNSPDTLALNPTTPTLESPTTTKTIPVLGLTQEDMGMERLADDNISVASDEVVALEPGELPALDKESGDLPSLEDKQQSSSKRALESSPDDLENKKRKIEGTAQTH